MREIIAFASWNYINLRCYEHKTILTLTLSDNKPVYRCEADGCNLRFPAEVYERVLDDVVNKQNSEKLIIGESWKRRIAGTTYAFEVEACPSGKQVEVSVRRF